MANERRGSSYRLDHADGWIWFYLNSVTVRSLSLGYQLQCLDGVEGSGAVFRVWGFGCSGHVCKTDVPESGWGEGDSSGLIQVEYHSPLAHTGTSELWARYTKDKHVWAISYDCWLALISSHRLYHTYHQTAMPHPLQKKKKNPRRKNYYAHTCLGFDKSHLTLCTGGTYIKH